MNSKSGSLIITRLVVFVAEEKITREERRVTPIFNLPGAAAILQDGSNLRRRIEQRQRLFIPAKHASASRKTGTQSPL